MFDEQGPDLKPEPDGDDEVWLLTKERDELLARVEVLQGELEREISEMCIESSVRDDAEDRVRELERKNLALRLTKVWELKIAGRSIVLRYENGAMSAVATLQSDDDVVEEFELDCIDQRGEVEPDA